MSCCSFLGRLLLVIVFIGAGVSKFQDPKSSIALLNARYPGFHNQLAALGKQYGVTLPEQLSPNFIKQQSNNIILGVAGAEVGLGLLVVLGFGFAGQLLSLLCLSFIAVIHNPYIHGTTQTEKLNEMIQALFSLGLAGALLLVGKKATVCAKPADTPVAGGKKTKTAPAAAAGKAKAK